MKKQGYDRIIRKSTAGLLAAACLFSCALSEGYVLPGSLITVEADAFSGTPALREVTVPSTLETDFAEAFPEADETVWVHMDSGDLAAAYLNAGLDVDADTVYRALLIGQTYPDSDQALTGPANDITAMNGLLTHLDRTNYHVTVRSNLTAAEILSAIPGAFSGATAYDVSLFYYSGHGNAGGLLVGYEDGKLSGTVSPAELRSVLDQIPGRKVVMIDACFSGGYLEGTEKANSRKTMNPQTGTMQTTQAETDSSGTESGAKGNNANALDSGLTAGEEGTEEQSPDPAGFNASFLSAFAPSSSGGLRKTGARGTSGGFSAYYVMTASAADEQSYEGNFSTGSGTRQMGIFTYYLCSGCGWDGLRGTAKTKAADTDGDGLVTFGEAFSYAKRRAASVAAGEELNQNAQSNAGDLQSFSPVR